MTESIAFGPKIYLDTNPIINAVEGDLEKDKDLTTTTRRFLSACRNKPGMLVTSEITLAELLAPIKRPTALPYIERARLYYSLLVWNRDIELVRVSRDIILETARIRNHFHPKKQISSVDAIHLVTAIQSRCGFFVSSDGDIPVPEGMTKIGFNRSGMNQLIDLLQ